MGLGDKIENMKDDLVGKGKEAAGKATDDERLEAEGRVDQSEGRPQAGRREGQGRLQELTHRTHEGPHPQRGGGPSSCRAGPDRRSRAATSCRPTSRRRHRRRSRRRR